MTNFQIQNFAIQILHNSEEEITAPLIARLLGEPLERIREALRGIL
jgi:hypothetical protein